MTVKALARTEDPSMNRIERVELLGAKGKLRFIQTASALSVELPAHKLSELTCALKITGDNLKPAPPPASTSVIRPDANGNLTLSATNAELHGSQLQLETKGGVPDIGFWDKGDESVSWVAQISKAGSFKVSATVATLYADSGFVVDIGGQTIEAQAPVTGSWENFQTFDLGKIQLSKPGDLQVKVGAKDPANWKAINLNSIQLSPAD